MKKLFVKVLASAMACALVLSCSGCGASNPGSSSNSGSSSSSAPDGSGNSGGGNQAVVLSCATKVTEDSFEGKTYQRFADLVKEYTNGSVEIQIYPSEQLGDSTTTVNNMQLGTIDMYIEGSTFYSGYGVDVSFTTSPFLMTEWEEYQALVLGEFGQQQMEQMESAGFKMLCTDRSWQRGPYYVTCSTKPISNLDDMKSIKFRSADSAAFMAAMSFLGVSTTVVNYSECYMALNQGTVEAVNCPVSNVESMAFWEVGPYVTYMNCYPQELWPVINLNKFNSLSQEQQDALIKAANTAAAESNEELYAFTEAMITRLEGEGATFNMDFDCSVLQDALHDYYVQEAANGNIPKLVAEYLKLA